MMTNMYFYLYNTGEKSGEAVGSQDACNNANAGMSQILTHRLTVWLVSKFPSTEIWVGATDCLFL